MLFQMKFWKIICFTEFSYPATQITAISHKHTKTWGESHFLHMLFSPLYLTEHFNDYIIWHLNAA